METNGHTPATTLTVAEALQAFNFIADRLHWQHGVTHNGQRDTYEILGYERHLTYQDYYARYERGGIAKPIIDAFAEDTWRLPPQLREVEKPDETVASPFETIWEALVKRLGLWDTIMRLDRQQRLGHFALLILGLRGQNDLSLPASPVRDANDLLYVQAFSEEHCEIVDLVTEADSPRFLQPRLYRMDFSRGQGDLVSSGRRPALAGPYDQPVLVHASRVIHVSEGGLEDTIMGTPGLKACWNDLSDLYKETGGSAEMTWKDGKGRIVASVQEGAVLSQEDEARFDERVKQFVHNLLDVLQVQGIDVQQLRGQIHNISSNVATRLDLIAGTIRMPKRRFLGSERGELASSEDEGNWLVNVIGGRQKNYGERVVLNPLVDTCVDLRVLPPARRGYAWEWPPLLTETETEKANTALGWSKAIATYAGPGGSPQEIIPVEIFLSDILGWAPEQVERIMDMLGEQEAARLRQQSTPPDTEDEDEADDENALTEEE